MKPYDWSVVEPDITEVVDPEWRAFWTWRRRFWKRVHGFVNRLAWRYAKPPGPVFGSALRIDRTNRLWRLNDAVAKHWSGDWIAWTVARRCEFQVEWDEFCQRVLAKHWPDVPRFGDIADVDFRGLGRVDLLAGGFPCQPVSVAGHQRGRDDVRWLWPEYARAVRELRPRYVLVENVRNLLAIDEGGPFGEVAGDLAALGYDKQWDCIPASAFGAPHERDRLWLLAYSVSAGTGLASYPDRGQERGAAEPRQPTFLPRRNGSGGAEGLGADSRDVADADGSGLSLGIGSRVQIVARLGDRSERPGDDPLADTDLLDGEGVERGRDDAHLGKEPGERPTGLRRGTWGHRVGAAQSRVVRAPDGLPSWMDGHRWPAPPGPQYEWEPPRTVTGRVPNRASRIKSIGNAVVPQVVEFIGRRILEAEALTG